MQKVKTTLLTAATVLIVLTVLSVIFGLFPQRVFVDVVEGKVTEKYIKRYGEKDYFHVAVDLSTGESEVYQNRDSLWWFKFNSADAQQAIKVGQEYRLTVVGLRIPLFSKFRNIVKYEPVS